MITDERKQYLIECSFYQAENVPELRWLSSQFALVLKSLPFKAQFQLRGALERRVAEVEGVANAESSAEVGNGEEHDEAHAPAGGGSEVLRTDTACGEGSSTEVSERIDGSLCAQGGG